MPLVQEAKALYNALINSGSITYDVLPDGATSTTLTSGTSSWGYGSWAQIASSVGTSDVWIVGVCFENPSDNVEFDVDLGTGASGSESAIGTFPVIAAFFPLPYPIKVSSGTRLAGRCRSSTTTADTIDVKVVIAKSVQ